MRALIITSSFHPVVGGAETYAYEVARGLAQAGHLVHVVTDLPRGARPGSGFPQDPEGVTVRRLHRFRELLADESKIYWEQMAFGLHPELESCALELRPDVVLTNSLDTAVLGKTLALALGIPWAAAFHEQDPAAEPLGGARMRLVYQVLAPDLVLAGSEFYADRARRWGRPEHVEVIHHGVDTDRFHPGAGGCGVRNRYGVPDGSVLVVCAGRFKARKGQLETLRAFAVLHEHDPAARLLLVGSVSSASEEYARQLEAEVDRLGLRDAVRIDREVTFDRMPAVLAAADIVAQPSHAEGLGLAVLEAMSSGRATVTTDITGVREILTVPGIAETVPPGEVAPLAAVLVRLAADRDGRSALGGRAREHVTAAFSRQRMVARTESALAALVARNDTRLERQHV
ncbi:glycosyltransferase family 4 protein [Kitasatospora azatica]|uniref:glycosyltransferase family 4 protein n=1 Tax=Kitasatospora azatica TaxID=58347 RepID=UPI000565CFDD|nr:glycosyltransferase family 4 protein [Kitasatospora azatica]